MITNSSRPSNSKSLYPEKSFSQKKIVENSVTIEIFKKILKTSYKLLSFPRRYLGSKTWSLPSILIYALMGKKIGLKQGYHYNTQKKLTAIELKPYLKLAATSAASFKNDAKWLEGLGLKFHDFHPNEVDLKDAPGIIVQGAVLFDPKSGLKVSVVENDKEVFVNFGAHNCLSNELTDKKEQKKAHTEQFQAASLNLLGAEPKIYEQANAVIAALQQSRKLKNKKWTLIGQSFGGGLAQYVGLQKEISTVCFNSTPLGAGLQKMLGKDKLIKADELVTHISVENDVLSDFPFIKFIDYFLSFIGIRTPGNFGQRFSIPSAYGFNIRKTHDYVLGSIMHHLGYHIKALPKEAV